MEIVSLLPKIPTNAPHFGAGVTEAAGLLSGNHAPLSPVGEELLVEGEQKITNQRGVSVRPREISPWFCFS